MCIDVVEMFYFLSFAVAEVRALLLKYMVVRYAPSMLYDIPSPWVKKILLLVSGNGEHVVSQYIILVDGTVRHIRHSAGLNSHVWRLPHL